MARTPLDLLFLNTYLLRVFEAEIGSRQVRVASKPRVTERARELGHALRGNYDVLALAEIFDERDLHALLAAWDRDDAPQAHVGPVPSTRGLSQTSGLATVVDGPTVGRVAARGYETRGRRLHDADAWAEKGALLCELLVGDVTIELTSTHLLAGGGLFPRFPWTRDRSDEFRSDQLRELRAFVDHHHRPGNLQLIVGDFNVPSTDERGESTEAYRELAGLFEDLDDLWHRSDVRGRGPTADIVEHAAEFTVDPDDARFYVDQPLAGPPPSATSGSARIDYAFGSPEIEVRNLRRRRLARPEDGPGRLEISTLSDHVGLHLELLV